jgi:hypothetical protein
MIFRIFKKDLEDYSNVLLKNGFEEASEYFSGKFYGDDNRRVDVKVKTNLSIRAIEAIESVADEKNDKLTKLDCIGSREILKNPNEAVIKSLKGFISTFHAFIKRDKIDGWLYQVNYGLEYLPYLIKSCEYKPANPVQERRASVSISFLYTSPNKDTKTKSIVLHREDVHNRSIVQILADNQLYKENVELKSKYEKNIEVFNEYSPLVGAQFVGLNNAFEDVSYTPKTINIEGHKLVNDQNFDDNNSVEQTTNVLFFSKYESSFDFSEEDEEDMRLDENGYEEVTIPYHPYIRVFDLKTHKSLWVVSGSIEKYKYDKNIHNKLILPDDHRDLIDVLVNESDVILEDIVSGKSGGTTILCKGNAGLGKTLTAEVYSEIVEKPVYSVHSGQLGTSPDNIDKILETVLERAEKWKAILLLDEADVYIRKRDNSMQHNAIVAAFLRRIERFDGIMFLTTNRSDDVDPAIISRCSAIIDYKNPDKESLFKIWKVLSENYSVKMSDTLIEELSNKYNELTGRDVKELLKLARRFIAQKDCKIDLELFRKCAMFRGIKF